MSWDVLLIRTKTNREAMDEIKSENIILFSQAEIAREIGKIATELGAVCDCQDLSWQNLDSDSWSIEFNVGKNAETESVMLHIRGSEPKEVLTLLPVDLNAWIDRLQHRANSSDRANRLHLSGGGRIAIRF